MPAIPSDSPIPASFREEKNEKSADREKFRLISHSDTCYEAEITGRGTYFHVIAGKHHYGNYICIPNHDVGSELLGFGGLFWN